MTRSVGQALPLVLVLAPAVVVQVVWTLEWLHSMAADPWATVETSCRPCAAGRHALEAEEQGPLVRWLHLALDLVY